MRGLKSRVRVHGIDSWRILEAGLWLGGAGMGVYAALTWSGMTRTPAAVRAEPSVAPETVALFDADSLANAIEEVKERELFGATQPLGSGIARSAPLMVPPQPPRQPLLLRGLVGGPPWQVVLEGVPGHMGSVVLRSGELIAGMRLRGVIRDTALIQMADTTWRLTVRRQ